MLLLKYGEVDKDSSLGADGGSGSSMLRYTPALSAASPQTSDVFSVWKRPQAFLAPANRRCTLQDRARKHSVRENGFGLVGQSAAGIPGSG